MEVTPMGKKRRFNYYEPSADESTSETLTNTELPEADSQVATEKEVEEVSKPVEVKPIIEKVAKVTRQLDKVLGKKGHVNVLCNMRKSPRVEDSNILNVLPKDTKIEIFENPGEFYRVAYNGSEGYIRKDLCVID
jgi:hypothetical protein